MKKTKTGILLLFLLLSYEVLLAQISISPPYVSVDGKSGIGNMFITNTSTQPQEVEISFVFGYPGSNSEGNTVMIYTDTIAYKQYAMDPVVHAFPRTFILSANKQRAVRVQVKPSPGMKDGFYFTRAKIQSKPQTTEVTKPVTDGITTNIIFNFEQVIPAFYKRGTVTTGLKVGKIEAIQKDTLLIIKAQLDRTGDAPYIGSMIAKLRNSNGKVVASAQSSTTAYFSVLRRLDMSIANITPDSYKLELTFETKRGDMAITDLVQASPVSESVDVLIK
ncbi:MAG: hypothetical protein WCK09_19200 [Bacteroidota bacterium]